MTIKFIKGLMPVKRTPTPEFTATGRIVREPVPEMHILPATSITAQKKAKIAADAEQTAAIKYFFETWCGNIADPYRGP